MNAKVGTVLTATLLWFASDPAAACEPPPEPPLQGAVVRGHALAVALRKGETSSCTVPTEKGWPELRVFRGPMSSAPARWHVGFGYFWPVESWSLVHQVVKADRDSMHEELYRYRLTDLLAGKLRPVPGVDDEDGPFPAVFAVATPLQDLHALDGEYGYRLRLHYDFLPVAEDRTLLFVLTDAPRRIENEEEAAHPKWSFRAYGCRSTWDARTREWTESDWRQEDTLPIAFTETFQALGKGDDYYFVTRSGQLYRAAKPDKGKDRKMEAVWNDAKHPVVAFITDADADRTFLFCKPDDKGNGVYFEMGEKAVTAPYHTDALPFRQADADEPLPAVLAYAKILLADKKIKAKE